MSRIPGLPPRRSDVTRWRTRSARLTKAEALLLEARHAVLGELEAAGWDEVKQHPTLKANSRLVDRIDRFLSKGGTT